MLRPGAYLRYMDDFTLFDDDAGKLEFSASARGQRNAMLGLGAWPNSERGPSRLDLGWCGRYRAPPMGEGGHDAFLSYNWQDREAVQKCASRLERERFRVFFDQWTLTAGAPWRPEIAQALETSRAALVFFGPHGAGNVHVEEMRTALHRALTNPHFPVIGVHLPGSLRDAAAVPDWVGARTWVEFTSSLDEEAPWRKLLEGLRRREPGPPPELLRPEPAAPRLELELHAEPGGYRSELRTSGGRVLRTGIVPARASGAALAEAVFGPPREHAALAAMVVRGQRPEGLLELGARLDVMSHDESALCLPWRSLEVRGQRLELSRAPWSFALHRLGLPRAAVRLRLPWRVWRLDGRERPPAQDPVLQRLGDRQPGLTGYMRRFTTVADALHFAPIEPPRVVHATGRFDPASGALELSDGWLDPARLGRAMGGAEPALVVLEGFDAPTPLPAALAWDSHASSVLFFPAPSSPAWAVEVLDGVASGQAPPLAVAKAAGSLDDRAGPGPQLLARFTDWGLEGAPRPKKADIERVVPYLDRHDQRRDTLGHVHELLRERTSPCRMKALFYFGPETALPSRLSDVIAEYLGRALGADARLVPLAPGPLPPEAAEAYRPMAAVQARLQQLALVPDESGLVEWLRSRCDLRRKTVFWVDWGCYPEHGRNRKPSEVLRWFAGERDFLRRGILEELPDAFWVSAIGVITDSAPSKVRSTFDKYRAKHGLEFGFAEADCMPQLDAPGPADLRRLLFEQRSLFGVDDGQRDPLVAAMFAKHDHQPSFRDLLDELLRLYELGPTEYLERFEASEDEDRF